MYLIPTRTTTDFPEDRIHRAKIVAAQRRTTLKELVMQGVDYVISHPMPELDAERERKQKISRLLSAMKAANTQPMSPLSREVIYAER